MQLPGSLPLFIWLVRNWNYRVAKEKYESLIQGQVAQREDDLVARFRAWHENALANHGQARASSPFRIIHQCLFRFLQCLTRSFPSSFAVQPYFTRWDDREVDRYGPQIDDADTGTYGLKKSYVQNGPKDVYAPLRP